jgi:outer membrane protein assembly factor BamA
VNQIGLSLNYDSLFREGLAAADGTRGQVAFRRAFNLSGQDCSFSGFDVDLRRYVPVSKRCLFAFRGAYGRIFGPGSDAFNYYLGGYGTLRGLRFLDYSGSSMFRLNSEFRVTRMESLRLDWPFRFPSERSGVRSSPIWVPPGRQF